MGFSEGLEDFGSEVVPSLRELRGLMRDGSERRPRQWLRRRRRGFRRARREGEDGAAKDTACHLQRREFSAASGGFGYLE